MKHPTTTEILSFVDGVVLNGEKQQLLLHLEGCVQCRRDVEFQRSLDNAARRHPLVRPSQAFTASVLSRVIPSQQGSWITSILNNLGNVFAMIMVLGILGYTLTHLPKIEQSSEPSQLSVFTKAISDSYTKLAQGISSTLSVDTKKAVQETTPDQEKLFIFIIVTFIILGALDRLVIRRLVRLRS